MVDVRLVVGTKAIVLTKHTQGRRGLGGGRDRRPDLDLVAAARLLDRDVPQVQEGGNDAENRVLLVGRHPNAVHRGPETCVEHRIVPVGDLRRATLVDKVVRVRPVQLKLGALFVGGAAAELIENVVVALRRRLVHNPTLLQHIGRNRRAHHLGVAVKMNLGKLACEEKKSSYEGEEVS